MKVKMRKVQMVPKAEVKKFVDQELKDLITDIKECALNFKSPKDAKGCIQLLTTYKKTIIDGINHLGE